MIRLAVIGGDETRRPAIVARLRGVTLETVLDDCDAAVILGPTPGAAADLLRAGKDVLMTLDALPGDHFQILSDIATDANARLMVANLQRYLPSRQLIRQQLDAGKFGEPGLIRLHHWAPANSLVCDLDLILWYFGKPPSHIHTVRNELVMQVHLGFPGGGMALFDYACMQIEHCYLTVIGASGAAYADDHQNTQLLLGGGAAQGFLVDEGVCTWAALVRDFVDHVTGAAPAAKCYPCWQDTFAVAHRLELT